MFNSNASSASSDANYIEDVFSNYLYTGNSSNQTITNNIDLSTKGGLVWVKSRSGTYGAYNNTLTDTARGVSNILYSDNTNAQTSLTGSNACLTAFNTAGFSLGADAASLSVNQSSTNYVSWTFQEQEKFFDVVTWTGDGTTRNISHNLGSVPGCIIVKCTTDAQNWMVYHRSLSNTEALLLNSTAAVYTGITAWGSTTPTSTVFTVAGEATVNASGQSYVAYLFAHDAGGFGLTGTDNVISCGSFTTDGSAYANVNLGYEPQWVLQKRTDSTQGWYLTDNMRGSATLGGQCAQLFPNTAGAESSGTGGAHPTATGFESTGLAVSANMIYIAIRRGPMKVPTDGTTVFSSSVRASGTGAAVSTTGVGFPPDLLISTERTTGVLFAKGWHDRLRGNVILISNSTNNEAADSTGVTAYGQDGFSFGADGGFATVNYSGSNYVYEALRRAPSFFDEVCYTGTGVARTVTHNLAAVPEMMIVKSRSTVQFWPVYHKGLNVNGDNAPQTDVIFLNNTNAAVDQNGDWNDTAPTSTNFTVGVDDRVNKSAATYVAYLFATCAGVSKVGSYTGTATIQQINCGFTAGARFVLIKRADSTGDWYVWDSARGIVSGNDPYFLLNTNAAEVTSTDYVDTYAAGFELTSTAPAALNASGGSYIFLAIA